MSDYFDRVERHMVSRVEAGVPRSSRLTDVSGYVAVVAAVAVVIVVVGVFLASRGGSGGTPSPAAPGGVRVSLSTSGTHPPTALLDRAVVILGERLRAVFPEVTVTREGEQIVIDLPNAPPGARSEILALVPPGILGFGDWERDAVTPNGKTVASQLKARNPAALEISQGTGTVAPGGPGAGCLSRAQALALSSTVPGSVVLRAVGAGAGRAAQGDDFYVLKDVPALSNSAITKPRADVDPNTHEPIVTFDLTPAGKRAFHALTATIARRGALVSSPGQTFNQHFVIALDNTLLTVPYIDYKQYPDGINGDRGADISGNFSTQSAKNLSILLRYGPLPVSLTATG